MGIRQRKEGMELLELIVFGYMALILLVAVLIITMRRPGKIALEERLQRRTSSGRIEAVGEEELNFYEKLQLDLKQSGVNISVSVYFLIGMVAAVTVFFLVNYLLEDLLAGIMAALAIGIFVPRKVVSILRERKMQEFDAAFSKALKRMSASMRAGETLLQAIQNVVDTLSMPKAIREEMAIVIVDYDYGDTIDVAFRRMADRTGVSDVQSVAISIEIGMRKGSKLFEVFDNYVEAIMDRKESEAEARATLASTRSSINILATIPFIFTAAMKFMNPSYFDVAYAFAGGMGKYIFFAIFGFVLFGYAQLTHKCNVHV